MFNIQSRVTVNGKLESCDWALIFILQLAEFSLHLIPSCRCMTRSRQLQTCLLLEFTMLNLPTDFILKLCSRLIANEICVLGNAHYLVIAWFIYDEVTYKSKEEAGWEQIIGRLVAKYTLYGVNSTTNTRWYHKLCWWYCHDMRWTIIVTLSAQLQSSDWAVIFTLQTSCFISLNSSMYMSVKEQTIAKLTEFSNWFHLTIWPIIRPQLLH